MQTYQEYLAVIQVDLSDTTMIYAPCCKRRKPVFAMRPRADPIAELALTDDGFKCDSCEVDGVRSLTEFFQSLGGLFEAPEDSPLWEVVRVERNIRLGWTDHFDIPRIRENINPEKLAYADEYRQWMRDVTTLFTNPNEAIQAIIDKPLPS